MIKLSWKKKVSYFSFMWMDISCSDHIFDHGFARFPWDDFLIGISPIVIMWGIYWVISGFKRDTKTAISQKTDGFLSNADNKVSPESIIY